MPFLGLNTEEAFKKTPIDFGNPHYIWCLKCFQHTRGSVFMCFDVNRTGSATRPSLGSHAEALPTRVNASNVLKKLDFSVFLNVFGSKSRINIEVVIFDAVQLETVAVEKTHEK